MSDKQLTWSVVEIAARWQAEEAIEFALNQLDALGTEINNLRKERGDDIVVKGYFNERPEDAAVAEQLSEAVRIYGLANDAVISVECKSVENTDWLAEWKKHWTATAAGKFLIAPPWEDVTADGRVVITIEPNMAFGTGTHETTRLCLEALGDIYRPGLTFMDVGTGTGILAIAVAKLGGSRIFACDTDEASIRIARENAAANGVGDHVLFADGPIGDDTPNHDVVCANLTIDVILPILPLLIEKARSRLLLSGILIEQEDAIAMALAERGVHNIVVSRMGEWICVDVRLS